MGEFGQHRFVSDCRHGPSRECNNQNATPTVRLHVQHSCYRCFSPAVARNGSSLAVRETFCPANLVYCIIEYSSSATDPPNPPPLSHGGFHSAEILNRPPQTLPGRTQRKNVSSTWRNNKVLVSLSIIACGPQRPALAHHTGEVVPLTRPAKRQPQLAEPPAGEPPVLVTQQSVPLHQF